MGNYPQHEQVPAAFRLVNRERQARHLENDACKGQKGETRNQWPDRLALLQTSDARV